MHRLIALGASNLTRGFAGLIAASRDLWGADLDILAALGHGRSYGTRSHFLFRTLPGILQAELWEDLSARPPVPTRGLVTDVGNDILYGFSAPQILTWVDEAVDRLQTVTGDIVLTDLPVASIDRLSPARFLFFRRLFFPRCRLSLDEVAGTARTINEGLAAMARTRGLRFVRLRPEWYGVDPIHIRPALWRAAWQEILADDLDVRTQSSRAEALRLYAMRAHREWILGVERVSPQRGVLLARGGRVRLY